jgi:hypothetical protein
MSLLNRMLPAGLTCLLAALAARAAICATEQALA